RAASEVLPVPWTASTGMQPGGGVALAARFLRRNNAVQEINDAPLGGPSDPVLPVTGLPKSIWASSPVGNETPATSGPACLPLCLPFRCPWLAQYGHCSMSE